MNREELRVVETSARVDQLPEHEAFALAVAFEGEGDGADGFVMVHSAKQGRAWELPGGKVEEDETFEETARREFIEETGRELVESEPCAVVVETYETGDSTHVVEGVVFAGMTGDKVRETDREIDDVRVVESLPDELTRITFDRGTFETLVAEARRTVKEDTDE